jgi:hypothetical protein
MQPTRHLQERDTKVKILEKIQVGSEPYDKSDPDQKKSFRINYTAFKRVLLTQKVVVTYSRNYFYLMVSISSFKDAYYRNIKIIFVITFS